MDSTLLGKKAAAIVFRMWTAAKDLEGDIDFTKLGSEIAKLNRQAKVIKVANRDRRSTFPFEKLPPEIRNCIYSLALTASGAVDIIIHSTRGSWLSGKIRQWEQETERGVSRPRPQSMAEAKVDNLPGKRQRKILFASQHSVSILLVSKTIHDEAASILYGSNRFTFTSPTAFIGFTKEIGAHRKLLHDVEIRGTSFRDKHNEMLEPLRAVTKLQRLHLVFAKSDWSGAISSEHSEQNVWTKLQPFVNGISVVSCECGSSAMQCICLETTHKLRFDQVSFGIDEHQIDDGGRIGYVAAGPADKAAAVVKFKERVLAVWEAEKGR